MNKIQSAIAIIKNNGSCHKETNCLECSLHKLICAKAIKIPKNNKVELTVQWLISVLGEKETKERLTEELL